MDLLQSFAQQGFRIFSLKDVADLLQEKSLSNSYSKKILHKMSSRGRLQSLGHGLYSLPFELLAGGPLHAFEIAIKIAKGGAISHRSAMFFHKMTDQLMNCVYITSLHHSSRRKYEISHTYFYVKRVQSSQYFGIQHAFIGEASICVTDKEKTLLDGLSEPFLCGGFREVLHAFEIICEDISADKLFNYISQMPIVVAKRLGWALETKGIFPHLQQHLEKLPIKTIQKLNVSGSRSGQVNKKWMLWENI